ncbi:MAG: amidase [Moraxellaceae bacterium]|nr:amidase [Moraxellaceae bacterium]
MSSITTFPIDDTVNAWVPHGRFVIDGAPGGPLAGLRFAVKDVFDVAGHPTGAGNPTWLATHAVPQVSSALVSQLLAAGAQLAGKVITDELAFSIHGDNMHYGMPINATSPARIPGGSSSGSVAAVAAHLVDFALGTDTGGSTRVPASYCGVWGLRSTHGQLSREGLVPLHPSFDTATWFAHDADTFARVGATLLPASDFAPRGALLVEEACAEAEARFQPLLAAVAAQLDVRLAERTRRVTIAPGEALEDWRRSYVTLGAREGWLTHGDWINTHAPRFSEAITERWRAASEVTAETAEVAAQRRKSIRAQVRVLVGTDRVLIVPSAATAAPLRDAGGAEIDDIRARTLRICCIAGLAGLPQVSLPFRDAEGLPVGISLIGPVGSDLALIGLAIETWRALQA